MPYFTVTTVVDSVNAADGQLSLREALTQANGSSGIDTIRFSATVVGQTLVLTGGELFITNDVIIDGNNGGTAAQTTIDADKASRVLSVAGGGTDATLNGLIITNGRSYDEPGGGIFLSSQSRLTITDCGITRNDTGGVDDGGGADGGGIFADSGALLTIERSTFFANSASGGYYGRGDGGGISVVGNTLLFVRNSTINSNSATYGGGVSVAAGGAATIESTLISSNHGEGGRIGGGGGLNIAASIANITRSTIANNTSRYSGGGINGTEGQVTLLDSSVIGNRASYGRDYYVDGGGIEFSGVLIVSNSTITGNVIDSNDITDAAGAGIRASGTLEISNSIVVGNFATYPGADGPDVSGAISFSNGHNVFGSDVAGNVPGDRENFAASSIFATVDALTGGGKLAPDGTVPLRNDFANPALSAADPLAGSALDQRGIARPLPAGSLPDLGAAELNQPLSTGATANNDLRTGTNAANSLTGLAGNDYLKGLLGNDTMDGGNGSDVLDGGPGNDKLTGGTGVDLVAYPGTAPVVIDLSGTADTAKRGSEKDTLIGIEGALGSSGADTFKGDALPNEFQGKAGKDTMTGGGGRDTWDFNEVADSPAGATRDIVTDFAPGQDIIDLAGIDADGTVPGNQSFRWVAKATLTGVAQLGYYTTGGMTIVRASTDADAAPELQIQLTGNKTLTEGDFRP